VLNQNKSTNVITYKNAGNFPYKILGPLGLSLFSLTVNPRLTRTQLLRKKRQMQVLRMMLQKQGAINIQMLRLSCFSHPIKISDYPPGCGNCYVNKAKLIFKRLQIIKNHVRKAGRADLLHMIALLRGIRKIYPTTALINLRENGYVL